MTKEKDDEYSEEAGRSFFKLLAALVLGIIFFALTPAHAKGFTPKYIFLFTGGMSCPQVQSSAD
ncbi:MAG: hypothetical protein WCR31_09840 [Treponema sp.]